MLAGCDDALLLTEVRKALTGLTVLERLVLGDRFGLGQPSTVSSEADLASSSAEAPGRRWIERRALRKLRTSGLGLREELPLAPTPATLPRRRTSVIVPLHGPRKPVDVWPPEGEPHPDPQGPDNNLWDEA